MSPTDSNASAGTIVLIHGLWMTPRSWEHWIPYYSQRGYQVLAPAWPGFEVEVEELRRDSSPIERLTLAEVAQHFEQVIGALDTPPLLIGHSAGGALVQILLDRGYGAAGVAIDSAPPEGIRLTPPSQLKSLFPFLRHPGNRTGLAPFTHEQFQYAFTNTLSETESRKVYERYYIPAPARIVWLAALANLIPGKQDAYVNFDNDERAPLLFIAGGKDHIMPPSVNKSNANHYKGSKATTDFYEFPDRSHFTCGEPGWEAVADYALDWAKAHATRASTAGVAAG